MSSRQLLLYKFSHFVAGLVSAYLVTDVISIHILLPLYTSDRDCIQMALIQKIVFGWLLISFTLFWSRWKSFSYGFMVANIILALIALNLSCGPAEGFFAPIHL